MKANELMLGDWVYDTILKGNTRVETLSLSGIKGDFHENVWDESTIEPIPLTSEILEKNGFERLGTDYILRGARFGLDNPSTPNHYVDNYWLCISIRPVHIRFVHELQHALRLCGINKEIVL